MEKAQLQHYATVNQETFFKRAKDCQLAMHSASVAALCLHLSL